MDESIVGAYCREKQLPVSVFYPEKDHKGQIAYAKSQCAQCKVRTECLDKAQERRELFGIWGGLTEWEREILRVQQALRDYSSPHKKPHEQEHQLNAFLSSPSDISDSESHTLQVSHLSFAEKLASQIDGIDISMLQSPGEFPSSPNRKSLFLLLQVEFRKFQERYDRPIEYAVEYQSASDPLSLRTTTLTFSLFPDLPVKSPILLTVPDLFQVFS